MIKIIKNIYFHPLNRDRKFLSILRFISWQVFSRIYSKPIIVPFTDKSTYLCRNGLTGLTGNLYYGLMEMEEMSFLLHFIRDEDCFFDIGSNVGAYTILASQHSLAEVHAFEPHPQTFNFLKKNMSIQKRSTNIHLHNLALGDCDKYIYFTDHLDTVNHVKDNEDENTIKVEMTSINSLCLPPPTLIKIDVEGYEWNVLKGATNVLDNPCLKVIIIELNGSGLNYGIGDDKIHEFLTEKSFFPYTYDPFSRNLIELQKYTSYNTIYIRDENFCTQRLNSAQKFKLINGVEL